MNILLQPLGKDSAVNCSEGTSPLLLVQFPRSFEPGKVTGGRMHRL